MGFLSSMLPTIVGVGVGAATGNPMLGAAAAGSLGYAQSGSLQKGLMAGLAGYGGAGIGAGLAGAGASTTAAEMAGGLSGASPAELSAAKTAAAQQSAYENLGKGISGLDSTAGRDAFMSEMGGGKGLAKAGIMAALPAMMAPQNHVAQVAPAGDSGMPQRLQYNPGRPVDAQGQTVTPAPDVPGYGNQGQNFGREQNYFPSAGYQQITPDQAKQMRGYAAGGFMGGGPVEQMSNANAIGANTGFPQADINKAAYSTPWQTPISQNVVQGTADTGVNSMTGEENEFAKGGLSSAASHLGDYSDGGRLLKGPGDGVSDSIPAVIGQKRPARLADGEFVVPARIVSELGNGSTEAGARKLYAMLDRVQAARKKSIGKGKVAKNSQADKLLPA
jgi:hypothetical protein